MTQKTDKSDAESVNIEKFNYDPASDSKNEWHEVRGEEIAKTYQNSKSVISESYRIF